MNDYLRGLAISGLRVMNDYLRGLAIGGLRVMLTSRSINDVYIFLPL